MSYALFESKVDRYDRTFLAVKGEQRPKQMVRGESTAPVLSKTRGFLGGFDYTMQFQVGCPGGCLFCYVSSAPRLAPSSIRKRWGFEVRMKRTPIKQLRAALRSGKLQEQSLYWSGVTDPYAIKPAVTRAVWQTLLNCPSELRPGRFVVQSRFRPDRDRNLMSEYAASTFSPDGKPSLLVCYSIGTDREDLIYAWERATPTYQQRMKAIEKLAGSGIQVVPTLSPFGIWSDLRATLLQFKSLNIPYITVLFFKEKTPYANTPARFLTFLRQSYPFLLDKDWQADKVCEMGEIFGAERVLVGKSGFSSLVDPPFYRSKGVLQGGPLRRT